MSSVEHGISLTEGLVLRAGHSMTQGTRKPPSHHVPLLPRKFPVDFGPAAPPLSLVYHTRVSSAIVSSRKAALRWRIVAVAPDLPRILFPLDSKLLELIRIRLKEHLQWLELQQQYQRQAARATGLTSDARNLLSQQRQFVQEQLTLTQRSLRIVAEAAQLAAGLDGQVDVHASLRETSPTDVPALLQLGSP